MRSSIVGKVQKNKRRRAKPGLATFVDKVLLIVRKIPRGKVLAYGHVAALAGVPRAARMVGGILFREGSRKRLPWQRVINAQGRISTYRVGIGEKQRALLEAEGHVFDRSGALDLKAFLWWPPRQLLKKLQVDEDLARSIQLRIDW